MAKYLDTEDWNTGEYISRDDALIAMQYCCENCDNYNGAMCRACNNADEMDIICDIPAADVQPVSVIKELQEHIKQRILETAFNNGGIYSEVAEDIANRIDFWVDEFVSGMIRKGYKYAL